MASPSPASFRSETDADRPFYVGLTGGIGSGKSTVADFLARAGAAIVDTDAIAHRLTAPGGEAIAPIRETFGAEFIDRRGALDRARMRELVFRDPEAKAALERILHPLIRARTIAEAAAADPASSYIVFVVPLLVESGSWADRVDRILVVDCSVAAQVARVRRRSSLSEESVRAIIAQQASRDARLAAADDVLVNEAGVEELEQRTVRVHALYARLARMRRSR